jgi:hypothetical protein
MDILRITGAKSLWHYFKFAFSACYRKQLQVEKAKQQQTLNELILKDKSQTTADIKRINIKR